MIENPTVLIPIISLLRRVHPTILASELCGVQPMANKNRVIFNTSVRYNYFSLISKKQVDSKPQYCLSVFHSEIRDWLVNTFTDQDMSIEHHSKTITTYTLSESAYITLTLRWTQ
jgi:hypothetical protein